MKTFFSPAKLNLFFHIKSRRCDGYHEVASLMQAVDLKDQLTFSISEKDGFTCNQKELISSDNLVLKALRLFREKTGIHTPLRIHLEKYIPCQAGLGGGSSNAATTLWALSKLFSLDISNRELMMWGEELGCDVPFFFSIGSAFCTGRGEKVTNMDLQSSEPFWLASPPFGMSTQSVYQGFKKPSYVDLDKVLLSFSKSSPIYFNDLETLAFQIEPKLKLFKQELLKLGFSQVVMTGSGSSFFCKGDIHFSDKRFHFLKVHSIFRKEDSWY